MAKEENGSFRLPERAKRHGNEPVAETRARLPVVEHNAAEEALPAASLSLRKPRKSAAVTVAAAFTSIPATARVPRSTSAPSLSR